MSGDEFGLLSDNAREAGLPWTGEPTVRRESAPVGPGREVSALVWGSGPPQLVLLHGAAQNAHTWDTVALALDLPLVAVDLPGHGHSSWRDDHDYRPATMAADLAVALRHLAPDPNVVVGMSLGGLVTVCLAAQFPDLVGRLALVDITPGTGRVQAEPILAFLSGPERFASFDAMLERTIALNPTRSVPSLRRGVLHNAREFPDGHWRWRWDPTIASRGDLASRSALDLGSSSVGAVSAATGDLKSSSSVGAVSAATGDLKSSSSVGAVSAANGDFKSLWSVVGAISAPILLIRGGRSKVVSDGDIAELLRWRPDAEIEVVADAGHSVQGDQPVELARRLRRFVA